MSVLSPTNLLGLAVRGEGLRRLDLRLVVTLSIGDRLLAVSTIDQGEGKVAHVPVAVLAFLQELDVHVGNGHGQTVVEADTT